MRIVPGCRIGAADARRADVAPAWMIGRADAVRDTLADPTDHHGVRLNAGIWIITTVGS